MSYRSFGIEYEDAHLLVVSKPAGVLTNMAETREQTLQDQVRASLPKSTEADAVPAAAAHRLDRYTSGLVVFGRTQRALEGLGELIRDGRLEKRYMVLVVGRPSPGRIEVALEKHSEGKRMMRVSDAPHAQLALTEFTVEEELGPYTLVAARIYTGRTHQLRVHFAHIGCPVGGDGIYGDKRANAELRKLGLQRQFIHARELRFAHPLTGAEVSAQAKLPKDLSRVLKALRAAG